MGFQPPSLASGQLIEVPNQIQEPLLLEQLAKFEQAAWAAQQSNSRWLAHKQADLRIYRAQLRRILQFQLYFLQVQTHQGTLHKIGVTRRPIAERIAEVERDLRAHYSKVAIEVLGVWPHRGNVELYFKHRYQDWNHRIGQLTEYFRFEEVEPVRQDLEQMEPKVLSAVERELLQERSPSLGW